MECIVFNICINCFWINDVYLYFVCRKFKSCYFVECYLVSFWGIVCVYVDIWKCMVVVNWVSNNNVFFLSF